ncbi:hypothetical protein [Shimia sp.]|uniref:hypothetical protein n=1 Tax=Shimia sp. TaxID=1954381 RepID=UPI00329834B9
MREQRRSTEVQYILLNYPDCPQRDMALKVLRQGDMDLANAWLDALDDMMARGHSLTDKQRSENKRTA